MSLKSLQIHSKIISFNAFNYPIINSFKYLIIICDKKEDQFNVIHIIDYILIISYIFFDSA